MNTRQHLLSGRRVAIRHCDVKPSNLLMRPDGQLVLMDFGLAKLLDNAAFAAQSMIVGTVAYLAPEQYQGLVTPASDMYMLGIILYAFDRELHGNTRYSRIPGRAFTESTFAQNTVTVNRKILAVQALPGAIALVLVWLSA